MYENMIIEDNTVYMVYDGCNPPEGDYIENEELENDEIFII